MTIPLDRLPNRARWPRAIVAVVLGLAAAWYAYNTQQTQHLGADFDHLYAAARAVMAGRDPYQEVGPGLRYQWRWPLFYPLTSVLSIVPLAWLPLIKARFLFTFLGAALFIYALVIRGGTRWRYLTLVSKAFQTALILGQASTYAAAMFVLPGAGVLASIKPNIAGAIVASTLNWRAIRLAIGVGLIVVIVSLVVQPGWPLEWLAGPQRDPFTRPPIVRPFGFLLALAVLRWRRPEARLLLALSIVPQTSVVYDALAVFFIPSRASEYIALTFLSHFAFIMWINTPHPSVDAGIIAGGNLCVWTIYLPALGMVLLRRNEGTIELPFDRKPKLLAVDARQTD